MKEKEKKNTIVKRMIFAVAAGFVVGFLMLFLKVSVFYILSVSCL